MRVERLPATEEEGWLRMRRALRPWTVRRAGYQEVGTLVHFRKPLR